MKEIRTQQTAQNTDNESRKVEGYAVVFNSLSSDLGGFFEIIEDGAITEDTINRSDILCLLDHDKQRGVLARSTNGSGSLQLSLDSHGLKYSFDAPKTSLGNEILEGLRRGDISKCSFAFTVEKDRWEKQEDGTIIRHIDKIKQLYDVSLVYQPAYEDTEVKADTRGLKELQERENNKNTDNSEMEDKAKVIEQLKALISQLSDGDNKPTEDDVKDTASCDDKEQKANEDPDKKDEETTVDNSDDNADNSEDKPTEEQPTDNNTEDNTDNSEQPKDDDPMDDDEDDTEKRNKNKNSNINIRMSKKFSLIKAINDVANNRNLDDAALSVVKEGRSAMAKSGLAVNGQIVLPVTENRAGELDTDGNPNGIYAQTATAGMENIATEKLDILEPLRANMVLSKAGATYLTGLVGNVSIPAYSGSNVSWAGEIEAAKKGNGKWSEVKLQPHRITAYVDVSREFLVQDSNDAEAMLRRDIINAIGDKVEATILGGGAGNADMPEGLFNGVTAMTTAPKFGDIVDAEAELDEANVNGAFTYILSPKAKAAFRVLSKDNGSGRMVLENGEIEGSKALVSSNVVSKGFVVGDWRDYVVAQWGSIDLVVDNYTKATEGQVRLVVNAYFDCKPRRSTSFVKRILK